MQPDPLAALGVLAIALAIVIGGAIALTKRAKTRPLSKEAMRDLAEAGDRLRASSKRPVGGP